MSTPTNSIRPDNPHQHVVNLKHNDSNVLHFDSLPDIAEQALTCVAELQVLINSKKTDPSLKPRKWILSTFWFLTNLMASDILTSISTFINDSQAVKETQLYRKLELDFITINMILHQHLELARVKLSFIRLLDVKSDDFHINQQNRLFEYVTSQSDALLHHSFQFIEQFSCALGSTGNRTLTVHLHRASVVSSIHTSMLKTFKYMLITHPLQEANAFLHSDRGKEVIHWAFSAMKLFTPTFIAEAGENLFGKLIDRCPLPSTTVERKDSENPLREMGTLRIPKKPPRSRTESSELTI